MVPRPWAAGTSTILPLVSLEVVSTAIRHSLVNHLTQPLWLTTLMTMNHILYETKNLVNARTYVGIHSTDDLRDAYLGSGKLLKQAITKYGKENFTRTTIAECPNREILVDLEATWVDQAFLDDPTTYNLVLGGGDPPKDLRRGKEHPLYGRTLSNETRSKMSDAKKGAPLTEGHKNKISNSNKGRVFSDEHRQNLSEALSGCHSSMLGKKQPTVICPHCGKEGGSWSMHRWHFDNCKLKVVI